MDATDPCRDCGDTATGWRFNGYCRVCFVACPGRPIGPDGLPCIRGGADRAWMGYINALRHPATIRASRRRAQERVALRRRREEARQAGQVAAFARRHPSLLTPDGQRALFVGPVVEDGCAYWLDDDRA